MGQRVQSKERVSRGWVVSLIGDGVASGKARSLLAGLSTADVRHLGRVQDSTWPGLAGVASSWQLLGSWWFGTWPNAFNVS